MIELKDIANHIPFMMMTLDGKIRPNKTRIYESLFQAGLIVGVLYMVLSGMKTDIADLKADIKQIRQDFYKPRVTP